MPEFQRSLIWRQTKTAGAEYCELWRDDGWSLQGIVVGAPGAAPFFARYRVDCDAAWRTRSASIEVQIGGEHRSLHILVDSAEGWLVAGVVLPSVANCLDVDLGCTPATNTLPIRRLGLALGESRDLVAAWVRFPDLTVEPLPQRYTRLGEHLYRYESRNGTFVTDIEVDDLALAVRYPPFWERGATGSR